MLKDLVLGNLGILYPSDCVERLLSWQLFNLTVLKDIVLGSLGIPFPSNFVERLWSWQLFNLTVLKDIVLGSLGTFSSYNSWQLIVILENMNTLNTFAKKSKSLEKPPL